MNKIFSVSLVIIHTLTLTVLGQSLETDITNYLIEKKILDSTEIFHNAELIKLDKKVFEEKVDYYDYIYQRWPIKRKVRVGVIDGKIYAFPEDFNLLTKYLSKNNLTKEQSVLTLMKIMLNEDDIIESHNVIDKTIEYINYKYEVVTWTKINGVRSHWYFNFRDNKINIICIGILEVFVGDYEFVNEGISGGSRVIYYRLITDNGGKDPKSNSVGIKNWKGEFITFLGLEYYKSENVIVVDNDVATPTEERNIEIWLVDFGYYEQVDVVISINYMFGTPTEIYNETLTTDEDGNIIAPWTVPSDVLHTGEYKITATQVNNNTIQDIKHFFIYEQKSGNFQNEFNYGYKIYFGDQFTGFNSTEITQFVNNTEVSIGHVYQEEIFNWDFTSPKNIDNDEFWIYTVVKLVR